MPRPNPPRKRPRRPAGAERARAGAELTKQTAQSAQQKQQPPATKASASGAAAPAAAPEDEMWSRRSYAILVALMAATETLISLALLAFASGTKDIVSLVAALLGLNGFQPITLAAAALLSAQVARRVAGEARPLRVVESVVVGLIAYLIFQLLTVGAITLLSSGSPSSGTGTAPTPCASGSACTSSPSAHPTATPSAAPSPSTSASASAGASGTPATTATVPVGEELAALGVCTVIAYVATVFVYPPVYKRLRVRPRPPAAPGKAAPGGRQKDTR